MIYFIQDDSFWALARRKPPHFSASGKAVLALSSCGTFFSAGVDFLVDGATITAWNINATNIGSISLFII